MLDKLLRIFAPEEAAQTATDDRLAIATLMVRIARTDGDYATSEIARIDRILSRRYGLDDAGVAELRTQAEAFEKTAPDTVRFTREIKDHVAYEDREAVLADLWSVVLADGERDDHEDALMRLLANLLGINDRDSALIRQRLIG